MKKIRNIFLLFIGKYVIQSLRRLYFYFLSENFKHLKLSSAKQPILAMGEGEIRISADSKIGVYRSPGYYTGYTYLEAREKEDKIIVGSGTSLNNNCTILAKRGSIEIGNHCLLGFGVVILNNDFHNLSKAAGKTNVKISDKVFIGSNTLILKGVEIGENSIIGANSVVTKSIPANVVAAGNPCEIVREI